jgi:hypothetical protein
VISSQLFVLPQHGDPTGNSKIEVILDNCAIQGGYSGQLDNITGQSYNALNARDGKWHQGYVDAFGTWLHLEGSFENGVMDLRRLYPPQQNPGTTVTERITWQVLDGDPNKLRQHWEWTVDVQTWTTIFDGIYLRN